MDLRDIIKKEPPKEIKKKETIKKQKKIPPFEFIKGATTDKKTFDFSDDLVKKSYDQFMINRWLSMDEDLIFLSEMLTTCHNLSDEDHYNMIKSALPQERFYLKYMRRAKDLTEEDKRYVADYFEIGIKHADDYINQMPQEELDEILNTYTYGKNERVKV